MVSQSKPHLRLLARLPGERWLAYVWIVAVAMIAALGWLRVHTVAQYAFASAAILPVLLVTWAGGLRHGLAISFLAIVMWVAADLLAELPSDTVWVPFFNGLTRFAIFSLVVYLAVSLRTLLQRERDQAMTDALTALPNRRAFFSAGEAETIRALRYGHPLAIIFIDLDNFKSLNDNRGHNVGDAALKAVASALRGALRATDTVARLGGDEFALIFPEISQTAATETGNKVHSRLSAALEPYPPVGASVGVAWFQAATGDFETMMIAADDLMYAMKGAGKGGVRVGVFGERSNPGDTNTEQ